MSSTDQLSFSQSIQIIPISITAEERREFWTEVIVAADSKWQTAAHILPSRFGKLRILFESGNEGVARDFMAFVFLASHLKDNVRIGGG